MAQFNGMVVTNKGRELLARALASKGKFIITAAALGDGAYSGNLRECEELVNKKLDLILMGVYSEKGSTKITVGITNKNVSESFRTNEIGVYAKLEGDAESVLYAYGIAVEADTMPNNSLGTTLELVYDIYFDVSSEVEVILEITDSIAFLTQDIVKRDFIKTDIISGGNLKDKAQLEADKQYYADDGKWYQNIGGDRVWTVGNGVPDSLFKEISWKEIYKDISENTNLILGNTGSEGIEFIQDIGTKIIGRIYFDIDVTPYTPYYCISTNTDVTVTSNFITASNKDLARRTRKIAVSVLYNGGTVLVNGTTSAAISFGTYQFLVVRVRRGQVDLHSNIVYQYMAGRLYVEGGGILLINSNGTITVENNGVSSAYTGIVEVQGWSFGPWL